MRTTNSANLLSSLFMSLLTQTISDSNTAELQTWGTELLIPGKAALLLPCPSTWRGLRECHAPGLWALLYPLCPERGFVSYLRRTHWDDSPLLLSFPLGREAGYSQLLCLGGKRVSIRKLKPPSPKGAIFCLCPSYSLFYFLLDSEPGRGKGVIFMSTAPAPF